MTVPAVTPDPAPGCNVCHRSAHLLAELKPTWWECSHVDCPNRRCVTAAPPGAREARIAHGSGCWAVKPVYLEE